MEPTADPRSTDESLSALAGALRGDREKVRALIERARERVEERARTAVSEKLARFGLKNDAAPSRPRRQPALRPRPVPPLAAPRPLQVRVRGKKVRLALTQPVAMRADLATLGQVTAENDRTAFRALRQQKRALDAVERSQKELAARVEALEEQSDTALLGTLQLLRGLQLQMGAAAATQRSMGTAIIRQGRMLRAQIDTARIQKIGAAVNSTQVAAYGEKGSVLATNNLLLLGNQLFWSFIDPLARAAGLDFGPSPSPLAWLAPLASLFTAGAALGFRQHERFVSGVELVPPGTSTVSVFLIDRVANLTFDRIRKRIDVPATAQVVDQPFLRKPAVDGAVQNGILTLNLPPLAVPSRVAWMVDLGADGG